jgi:hypothetical protein
MYMYMYMHIDFTNVLERAPVDGICAQSISISGVHTLQECQLSCVNDAQCMEITHFASPNIALRKSCYHLVGEGCKSYNSLREISTTFRKPPRLTSGFSSTFSPGGNDFCSFKGQLMRELNYVTDWEIYDVECSEESSSDAIIIPNLDDCLLSCARDMACQGVNRNLATDACQKTAAISGCGGVVVAQCPANGHCFYKKIGTCCIWCSFRN